MVQLLSPSSCVEKEEKKERENIYITGPAVSGKNGGFLFSLISDDTKQEKEKTRNQDWEINYGKLKLVSVSTSD